ncbi:MAG: sigma-70 family RNA polymerase sigma factor [Acidobacteriia bacterium]|nr:sigma-70 family RNA polymerase sigma factor [Terriglobia bacterium]
MPTAQNPPEDDLLRRAARGEEAAFVQIYRAHQATLYRFALRMTGSAWNAEEIVQESFMALLRNAERYDASRGELGAFLFGMARNFVRKRTARGPAELPFADDGELPFGTSAAAHAGARGGVSPAELAEQTQRIEQVRRAVLELPEEFREAVALCDLEEMSYEEAAKLLDCPIGTIRSRLHRGRALLAAQLEILRERPRKVVNR